MRKRRRKVFFVSPLRFRVNLETTQVDAYTVFLHGIHALYQTVSRRNTWLITASLLLRVR